MSKLVLKTFHESLEHAARVYGLDAGLWQRLWIRATTGISPKLTPDELELIDKIHLLASQLRQHEIEIV